MVLSLAAHPLLIAVSIVNEGPQGDAVPMLLPQAAQTGCLTLRVHCPPGQQRTQMSNDGNLLCLPCPALKPATRQVHELLPSSSAVGDLLSSRELETRWTRPQEGPTARYIFVGVEGATWPPLGPTGNLDREHFSSHSGNSPAQVLGFPAG